MVPFLHEKSRNCSCSTSIVFFFSREYAGELYTILLRRKEEYAEELLHKHIVLVVVEGILLHTIKDVSSTPLLFIPRVPLVGF